MHRGTGRVTAATRGCHLIPCGLNLKDFSNLTHPAVIVHMPNFQVHLFSFIAIWKNRYFQFLAKTSYQGLHSEGNRYITNSDL